MTTSYYILLNVFRKWSRSRNRMMEDKRRELKWRVWLRYFSFLPFEVAVCLSASHHAAGPWRLHKHIYRWRCPELRVLTKPGDVRLENIENTHVVYCSKTDCSSAFHFITVLYIILVAYYEKSNFHWESVRLRTREEISSLLSKQFCYHVKRSWRWNVVLIQFNSHCCKNPIVLNELF